MLKITIPRLELLALSLDELVLIHQDRHQLENHLGLNRSQFELNAADSFMEEFADAVQSFIIPNVSSHPSEYGWYTHWLIIHKHYNLTVGGIGAAGPPNEMGEVMVGYFVDRKYEGNGIATEALKGFMDWMRHPALRCVTAHTLLGNIPSQKVLEKCGFQSSDIQDAVQTWRYCL